MKTLTLVLLTLALSYTAPRAQPRGHAYGYYAHHTQIERVQPGVRVYTAPRVNYYQAPRTYYRQPAVSFSFPFGYSAYQPYQSYYYPRTTITTREYRLRARRRDDDAQNRFAREHRER